MLELYAKPLKEVPIIEISKEEQKNFIKIVDIIMKEKNDTPNADTSKYENEIDRLVYLLYELSKEEIDSVEKHFC